MVREIKFRAWDKEKEKIIINFYLRTKGNGDDSIILPGEINENNIYEGLFDEGRFDIMQYTGLKDIDGNEVYEGDIVESYDQLSIMEVVYNSEWACFELHLKKGNIGYEIADSNDYRVIGNIYEDRGLSLAERNE